MRLSFDQYFQECEAFPNEYLGIKLNGVKVEDEAIILIDTDRGFYIRLKVEIDYGRGRPKRFAMNEYGKDALELIEGNIEIYDTRSEALA